MNIDAAPGDAPSNTVSWQSAFWSLAPIALNSMTQPSSKVFGFPLRSAWVLRSSPIIYAGDAFYTLVSFLWFSMSLTSPRAAIKLIARRRLRDAIADETSSFSALQRNLVFRLMLFTFGALPQLLKLCGMKGIWATKLAGGVFFGSFLVLEVIVLLSSEEDIHQGNTFSSQAEENLERYLGHGVLAVSLWFDNYLMALAAHILVMRYGQRLWPYALGSAIAGFTTLVKMRMPEQEKLSIIDALMLVPIVIGTTLSAGLYMPLYEALKVAQSRTSIGLSVSAVILLALGMIGQGTSWHHNFSLAVQGKYVDEITALELAILVPNVLAVVLHYAFKFDPAGTVKPGWTDQLG